MLFKPTAVNNGSFCNNTYQLYFTSYWTEHDINIKVFCGNITSNFTPGTREHMYHMHK